MVELVSKDKHDELIRIMSEFNDDMKPKVGIFWYDVKNQVLFGVEKMDAELCKATGGDVTLPKLHKTYWQKQHNRAVARQDKASIFFQEHNYTKIPRGRIFMRPDGSFYVMVGNWFEAVDSTVLREKIEDEFNLPEGFEFRRDVHWDLGHGWSEELR